MRCIFSLWLTLLMIGVWNGDAYAQSQRSLTHQTKAGKRDMAVWYHAWDDKCKYIPVEIDITNPPKHGVVQPTIIMKKITSARTGTAAKCFGKDLKSLALYYTSNKSFVGSDNFAVKVSWGGKTRFVDNIRINVVR